MIDNNTTSPAVSQRQNAKEYLSQAFLLGKQIDSKFEQLSSLRDLATKATAVINAMPRSTSPDAHRSQNVIAKIVDLENEVSGDLNELVDLKSNITHLIKSLQNRDYQTLLELRYLCFKPWEQVADSMGYSLHHLYKLHNAALDACGRLMQDDTS